MKVSPLKELYPSTVNAAELAGCEVPVSYTTVEHEYDVLRHHVGIIDGVGYCILKVTGDDAGGFLDTLVTKDVSFLNPGKVSECLFLNEVAVTLGIAYVINSEDAYFVLVPPENAETVKAWILDHATDEVTVEDQSETHALAFIEGEKSWKIVKELFSFPVETLPLRDMTTVEHNGKPLMMSRIGRSGEYGYCFVAENADLLALIRDILEKFPEMGLEFCGTDALETCMLEISQPVFNAQTAAEGNLFELNEQWFVQFEKEEYCGHDKLMELFEAEREKLSVGFSSPAKDVPDGAPVSLFGEEVGKVLHCRNNPAIGGVLGLVLLRSDVAVSGLEMTLTVDGKDYPLQTLSSPFVRPLSWDSQME